MNNKIKFTALGFCALGISSCMMEDSTSRNLVYPAYPSYDNRQFYNQGNLDMVNYSDNYKYNEAYESKQSVVVPDSYHVGEMHSPVSFRDRDQTWVSGQNPQAYTIELAEGDKASQVAQVLYKAPKNDRMAQIKYEQGGKEYYRGVYGSYHSAEEAQKALDALPADIKGRASVKNWRSVQ
jgi:septal ring-binding cell division protein DamX